MICSTSICKNMLLLIFGLSVSLSLSSCKDSWTAWSAEARSPDGKMIARARSIRPSGIGTGDFGTFVDLNWTSGSQAPTVVLAFSDGSDQPDGMKVGMNWLTPTHLELTYKGRRTLDFEAVKCHGVDISVRELSGDAINSSK
jgi:hypothetical protein